MKRVVTAAILVASLCVLTSCEKKTDVFVSETCSCRNVNGSGSPKEVKTSRTRPTCSSWAESLNETAREKGYNQYWVCE